MNVEQLGQLIKSTLGIGLGSLTVGLHTLRILANRGLISPNEVENISSHLSQVVEQFCSEEMQGSMNEASADLMAEIRQVAKDRWIGRDGPDPEQLFQRGD